MSAQWKPGDVAMVPGVGPALRSTSGAWLTPRDAGRMDTASFNEVRPLVVIDPEDREQVERLCLAARVAYDNRLGVGPQSFDAMQAALRSLIAPPNPDEPTGLGAVVEVDSLVDEKAKALLVRSHAKREPWLGDGLKREWDAIDGPIRVLSPGVDA